MEKESYNLKMITCTMETLKKTILLAGKGSSTFLMERSMKDK